MEIADERHGEDLRVAVQSNLELQACGRARADVYINVIFAATDHHGGTTRAFAKRLQALARGMTARNHGRSALAQQLGEQALLGRFIGFGRGVII